MGLASACRVQPPAGPPLAQAVPLPGFDPAAIADGRPPELGPLPPLRVRDYSPEGVSHGERIRVRLNQPVVSVLPVELELWALPTVGGTEAPRRVPAHSRMAGSDTIELVPAAPLRAATAYEVVLPAGLESRNGSTLEELRWRFETPRPGLVVLEPDEPLPVREPFYVVADQPVRAEVLSEHLQARAPRAPGREVGPLPVRVRAVDWQAWPHAWRYEDWTSTAGELEGSSLFAIEPVGGWPRGVAGSLRVTAGLRGEVGPLPLLEGIEAPFATRDALRLLAWDCEGRRGRECESGPIVIRLSNPLAGDVASQVRVRPRPSGLAIHDGWDFDGDAPVLEIHGDFEPGRRYTVELPASLTDEHDQRLGRRVRVAVRMHEDVPEHARERPGPASLQLSSTRGTFLRPADARVGIVGAHVEQVRVRVAVLDDATRLSLARAPTLADAPWPASRTTVEIQGLETRGRDARGEHVLDLARFGGEGDAVLVELEAEGLTPGAQLDEPLEPVRGLFQISELAAIVELGPARGVARITRTVDGEPWPGVALRLHTREGEEALPTSDPDGLARLPGAETMVGGAWLWLDAPTGDRLLVPLAPLRWPVARGPLERYLGASKQEPVSDPPDGLRRGERALLAVETGRSLFFPNDTIHVAGWGAIATPYGEQSTRRAPAGAPVLLELRHRGDGVARRRVRIDRHGRFSASLPLPPGAPLGRYELRARMLESSTDVWLTVADVRIPAFELEASMQHRLRVRDEPNRLKVDARSLSGEPTPLERLRWSMTCHDTWPDLGRWDFRFVADAEGPTVTREGELEVTPASAHAELELPAVELAPRVPYICGVSVAAQDASLQEVGAETSFVVHPGRVYIGLRAVEAPVVGEPLVIEVVAVDLKLRRAALDGVELRIEKVTEDRRRLERGEPEVVRERVARCRLALTEEGEHSRCSVPRPTAGSYVVRATAEHEGFALQTDLSVVVEPPPTRERADGSSGDDDEARSHGARAEPLPARKRPLDFHIVAPEELPAGEPATVVVEAPWDTGKGLLSITQTGLRGAEPFVLRDGRAAITIVPRAGQGPVLELRATVARPPEGGALPRVHVTSHDVRVTEPRTLVVRVDAPARARPGERVPLRLVVRDPVTEQPVDARLAVWVIDDGVHQLHHRYSPELSSVFDPARPGLAALTLAHDALLAPFSPWSSRRSARVPQVRQAAGSIKGAGPDQVHTRFDAEPLFVGDVGTGPDGEAEVVLPLPHDLTRFRVTAIASAERPGGGSGPVRFGRDEATVEVSAPLMVRLAMPRVLRPGDEAELAALVTPPRGAEGRLEVELALEHAEGRLVVRGPVRAVRELRASDGRTPIRVPFLVRAEGPGRPEIRVHARLRPALAKPTGSEPRRGARAGGRSRELAVAVQRPLVVELERTAIERTAIYGRLDADEPVAIPVLVPAGVRPDHGGLTLAVRGTAVGDLDEAARYLEEYPYGCLEQTASRLLPLVALQGLADRLPAGTDPAARVLAGVVHLMSLQHADGTFGYWPADPEPAGHAGAYATWVLQLAADAGQPVPSDGLARALDAIATSLTAPLPGVAEARDLRRAEQALEVHVLVDAGRGDDPAVRAVLDDLHAHAGALPLFARAWLLMALHGADPHDPRVAALRRSISAAIEALPGSAHPVDTASDRYAMLFDSDARTHALVLLAWLRLDPADPVVDALAHGLRLRRRGGRWRNTQENAYALLALSAHARAREAVVPDHRIDAWVGPRRLPALELHGRELAPRERTVTMAELLGPLGTDRTTHVVLDREGEGAAYFRLGMEWVAHEPAPARHQGLSLVRRLRTASGEPVDAASLRAGQRYLLEVELESDVPQPYVALEVPLPAGLEAIDASLGAGGRARASTVDGGDAWIDHQELHRDRVLLFADELAPGRHVHAVPVLATTPGRYVLPAAVAEAMYSPEVRARTTAVRVRVSPSREGAGSTGVRVRP